MSYPRQQSPEAWATQLNFAGIERQHGLPAGVLTNLVRQESRGNCDATSPVGARGLCQFMPATARGMGVNASDPVSSVNGAARYLEQLMDMFDGDPEKAIAAYNCGPGNVRRALRHGADWRAHLPAETKNYLQIVGRGIGRSYVQRQEAGEVIPEDEQAAEAERRRGELREAGLADMSDKSILGALFFMMIKGFLEKKFSAMEGPAAPVIAPDRVSTTEPPHVEVPRTPATATRSAAAQPVLQH